MGPARAETDKWHWGCCPRALRLVWTAARLRNWSESKGDAGEGRGGGARGRRGSTSLPPRPFITRPSFSAPAALPGQAKAVWRRAARFASDASADRPAKVHIIQRCYDRTQGWNNYNHIELFGMAHSATKTEWSNTEQQCTKSSVSSEEIYISR